MSARPAAAGRAADLNDKETVLAANPGAFIVGRDHYGWRIS